MQKTDVIIIGAGAAGLMCAIEAAKRGRQVWVLDHAPRVGRKILMSGGGRCNFTNYHIHPDRYLSHNPHFCKSALRRYTQWDFIELVQKHGIPFHEKTLGQLFCDNKASDIVQMLLAECEHYRVTIQLAAIVTQVTSLADGQFRVDTQKGAYVSESLVIATGGLSIPTMGASPLGYKVAEQFGLSVWPTRAALVPLTWQAHDKEKWADLSGVSVDSEVSCASHHFRENSLLTHRGLSGPAILQISSYWQVGQAVHINLLPEQDLAAHLKHCQKQQPHKQINTLLYDCLPKRLVDAFLPAAQASRKIADLSYAAIAEVAQVFQAWSVKPNGTEGYRTAEVTLGGVDCDALSSKTMEALSVKGLYFIGEVVDVSGWLGGYNFQWAWSSGWVAGQAA